MGVSVDLGFGMVQWFVGRLWDAAFTLKLLAQHNDFAGWHMGMSQNRSAPSSLFLVQKEGLGALSAMAPLFWDIPICLALRCGFHSKAAGPTQSDSASAGWHMLGSEMRLSLESGSNQLILLVDICLALRCSFHCKKLLAQLNWHCWLPYTYFDCKVSGLLQRHAECCCQLPKNAEYWKQLSRWAGEGSVVADCLGMGKRFDSGNNFFVLAKNIPFEKDVLGGSKHFSALSCVCFKGAWTF